MAEPPPAPRSASAGKLLNDSFPRQASRTQWFTLGAPRSFTVTRDGKRVLFLRSRHGADRANCLWSLDVRSGSESLVVDPTALLASTQESLSTAERARRERSREASAGVVAYATDQDARLAAFALSSRLWVVDLSTGDVQELPAVEPVIDPRPDPTGAWIAYASRGALRIIGADASGDRALAEPDAGHGCASNAVTWGVAEFVAAEEMQRTRGFWWSPDGTAVLAARVDESRVQRWHIADPANPAAPPMEVAYPIAGTPNAEVSAHLLGLDGTRVEVAWDVERFPYLINASWTRHGDPLLLVMSRDQTKSQILAVDPGSGRTRLLHSDQNEQWLDVVPGVPAWTSDGRLVRTADQDDTRRLFLGETAVTPSGLQVSHVVAVEDDSVLFAAAEDPTESHVWLFSQSDGLRRLSEPGTYSSGTGAGGTFVRVSRRLDRPAVAAVLLGDGAWIADIRSFAEQPCLVARPRLFTTGHLDLRVGLVLPRDHVAGTQLPVLLDPYGGPHHREVLKVQNLWLEPQWFADQGFAVVVADGRGTGGRGPVWDRAVHRDLASVPLADQVDALLSTAQQVPDLDVSRVAIRGWSFGGYLATLAVLRRPDVFCAAIAGAPVTDWRLYDTFYTERYLGHPDEHPDVYAANSLLAAAPGLERPLLLIHGLADDNVVAAHSLRLSSALLAAARPHDVLPLSGVTHMASQEVIAENLLLLQVEWLHRALARN